MFGICSEIENYEALSTFYPIVGKFKDCILTLIAQYTKIVKSLLSSIYLQTTEVSTHRFATAYNFPSKNQPKVGLKLPSHDAQCSKSKISKNYT